jgi:trk system potassium uptake protein
MIRDQKKLEQREHLFKLFFIISDWIKSSLKWIIHILQIVFVISIIMSLIALILFFGFNLPEETRGKLIAGFRILFMILLISKILLKILTFNKKNVVPSIFGMVVILFTLAVLLSNFGLVDINKPVWTLFTGRPAIIISIFVLGVSELSLLTGFLSAINFAPALLFSLSFLMVIITGAGLLMLPKSHTASLSLIDALFTSVSAVCVTGLIVVDTATAFTPMGKIIILSLIQIGGLGIMTFTGFFSFVFTSGSSYSDRLMLKEIFSSESLDNLFKLLSKIILWTVMTEIAGAILIYYSLNAETDGKMFFSLFHSVSAFCNAGFSTLTSGLYTSGFNHNYSVQITVALLIILGGIGFPVLLEIYSFFRQVTVRIIRIVFNRRIMAIHSGMKISGKMAISMTIILLLLGTGLYFLFESGKSLEGMSYGEKLIISFFGSVSARTAGFNIIDLTLWGYPTIFLMIFLMWIGASPGSTGGGIKTTTFYIALKSTFNLIRGRQQLKIGNREIGSNTISRVLAIIFLSILIITIAFFCLLISEPDKNPVHLLFESVSAFSTVGLSIAGTSSFSFTGKIVLILLMFIGRVGPLTLLIGLFMSYRKQYARYPEVDIIIN